MDSPDIVESITHRYDLNRSGLFVLGAVLARPHQTGKAIARRTGLSEATVSRWRRDARLHQALTDLGGDLGSVPWRAIWRTRWERITQRSLEGDVKVLVLQLQAMGILAPPSWRRRR